MVIGSRNPLYSVLSLVSVFLLSSVLVFSLEAEFLALSFVLIYVGAIAILFLFIVIMLDIKVRNTSTHLVGINAFIFLIFFSALLEFVITLDFNYTLMNTTNYNWINWFSEINHLSNTQMLGQILYTYYYLFFLIAGFILFIALIGSLMLTVTLNKSYKIN
jgi:NADH-quinone oxidoreductase subunit J